MSRIKWVAIALAVVVIAIVMFFIGWSAGHSSYDRLQADYDIMKAEYEAMKAEDEGDSKPPVVISYSKHYTIPTYHIAAVAISLGKGEVFEAQMAIYKGFRDTEARPRADGTIIFWIYDPNYRKVVDAGRIEGYYEFTFTVETSGDHILVFEDTEGECFIYMDYNSPASLRDASVR